MIDSTGHALAVCGRAFRERWSLPADQTATKSSEWNCRLLVEATAGRWEIVFSDAGVAVRR